MLRRSLAGCRRGIHNMVVAPHVREALDKGRPVVALESTIISHGMPYPRNLEVAKLVEDTVRAAGCVPATIAVINGVPKIGISDAEMNMLAVPRDANNSADMIWKASRRDLGYICAMKYSASTTVASTMILAHAASIPVFATGGIGGAHYDAQQTMDISADLMELGKTPVAVVSAGIKSILDLKLTMEVLETQGVPVIGYKCKEMPSFFTNSSGVQLPMHVQSPMEAARVLHHTWGTGSSGASRMVNGMLFTVPNPKPLLLEGGRSVEQVIREAVVAAREQGVHGAKITPFLLQRIEKLTAGQSLESNIALIVNNAKTAAEIACAYAELRGGENYVPMLPLTVTATSATADVGTPPNIVVIGGAVVDYVAYPKKDLSGDSARFIPGSSNPGTMKTSYGGVGRNIAEAIGRLGGCKVELLSSVGGDISGQGLLVHARDQCNIDIGRVAVLEQDESADADSSLGTASYTAIHNGTSGDLIVGIADMDIFQQQISPAYIARSLAPSLFPPVSPVGTSSGSGSDSARQGMILAVDGNVSVAAFKAVTKLAAMASKRSFNPVNVTVFFDGTSDVKCTLPLLATSLHHVDIIKPNVGELLELATTLISMNMVPVNAKTVGNTLIALRNRRDSTGEVKSGQAQPDSGSFWSLAEVRCMAVALYHAMVYVPSPAMLSLRNKHSGSDVSDADVDRELQAALLGAKLPDCYVSGDNSGCLNPKLAMSAATSVSSPKHVLVTLGALGVFWVSSSAHVRREHVKLQKDVKSGAISATVAKSIKIIEVDEDVSAVHIPCWSIAQSEIVNTSGAGDTFCGTMLHSLSTGPSDKVTIASILYALRGARASLKSKTAIPVNLRAMLSEETKV